MTSPLSRDMGDRDELKGRYWSELLRGLSFADVVPIDRNERLWIFEDVKIKIYS